MFASPLKKKKVKVNERVAGNHVCGETRLFTGHLQNCLWEERFQWNVSKRLTFDFHLHGARSQLRQRVIMGGSGEGGADPSDSASTAEPVQRSLPLCPECWGGDELMAE